MKGIGVRYNGESGIYSYKCLVPDVKVDDWVVVQVRDTIAVALVVEVTDTPKPAATKYAFQKIDTTLIDAQIAIDERLEALRKELKSRVQKVQEADMFERLLAVDPASAPLLEEFKKLLVSNISNTAIATKPKNTPADIGLEKRD